MERGISHWSRVRENSEKEYYCNFGLASFNILYLHIARYMSETTTIVIRQETKARLDELKCHPRESYSDVVDRLVTMATDDEPLSE